MVSVRRNGIAAIVLWVAFLLACGVIISRTKFTTDLSAFLPRTPTPEQQLLMDQLRDGLASRLILIGIEGADARAHAAISKQIAQRLRVNSVFVVVNNGEAVNADRDRNFLFNNRYLLSTAVTPEHFSKEGLRASIGETIDLLASPVGLLVKSMLPHDPTGEMLQLLNQFNGGSQPQLVDGAWASRDGKRALLMLQTRAAGSDTDAQQRAMANIQQAFKEAVSIAPPSATQHVKLVMTGPGVFSVTSRDTIKDQVSHLSIMSVVLVASLLLLVYRSFTALILGFLPVVSGALAGVAAVSLGFGAVHGITLGFGTALIGEAVDYSIYLFVQSEHGDTDQQAWIKQFWPTIRLGVLTSVFGFASLLLSGFPGLAQLGLYAIAGLVCAAIVTRYVLPYLLPAKFRIQDVTMLGRLFVIIVRRATVLRWPTTALLAVASIILITHRNDLLNDKIASLSPVSQTDIALDARLRADIGAPDVRYLVVASGTSQESALRSAERVSALLQKQVETGELGAFESPSRYLPSLETQLARQASLPSSEQLSWRLAEAMQGMPLRAEKLVPFLADVTIARSQPPIELKDLEKTSMAMAVDALLIRQEHGWSALLPLTAAKNGSIKADHIRSALVTSNLPDVIFVDMKAESDRLYSGYLHEATKLSIGGLVAIIALLLSVRTPRRVLRIIVPLGAAVITVMAGLAFFGQQLIILHLVGLLLVVAVGSNYALFFDQSGEKFSLSTNTLVSMAVANLTTVAGFGLLAFSKVSILQAMGVTVAPGVILALIYSAIFSRQTNA